MTQDELRAAAKILFDQGITEGRGPNNALARRLGVPLPTFHNWIYGKSPVPEIAARYINDLLAA